MRGFFYPESIAVIGVSTREGNMGQNIVANLGMQGFQGEVFAVGPKGGELNGRPIYSDLSALPRVPEMVTILTPAKTVPGLLETCGKLGIKRAVIETGGFSELSQEGHDLEDRLWAIAAEHDIRFIGPNCIGVICTDSGVSVPFPLLSHKSPKGGLSIVAQSGGIGLTYLHAAAEQKVGVAKFTSMGNKINVNERDLLAYLIEDPQTEIILLYLESIVAGREMYDLIRSTDKPVVVHKSNVGQLSHAIAQSHTSALANDDAVVDAALEQCGAIRVRSVTDCLQVLKGLVLPRPKGRRLAVISRSGGHAVVAADAAGRRGLELPPFPEEYLKPVQETFRASVIKPQNPLDLGDLFDFHLYVDIVKGALSLPEVDGAVVVHGYRGDEVPASRDFVLKVGELCREFDKPVAMCLLTDNAEIAKISSMSSLPLFPFPDEAMLALDAAYRAGHQPPKSDRLACGDNINYARAGQILSSAGRDGWLELPEALHLLDAAGVPVAPFLVAGDAREAAGASLALGYPVVLKAVESGAAHKTEKGGVVLNLMDEAEVEAAAEKMFRELKPFRVVVMAQIKGGTEVILGAKQDPSFGPLVLFGLGGVTAEVLKDVSLRLAPVDDREAGQMLDGLKGAALLKGFRGAAPASRPAILEPIMRVSLLVDKLKQIAELDINPLLVGPGGALAVDARVRVTGGTKAGH